MEQKAADMAEIDGVKVETLTDDKGYKAIKVTFDSGILFESGSYTLNEAAKASLSEFVEEMRISPRLTLPYTVIRTTQVWQQQTKESLYSVQSQFQTT